MTSRPRVVVRAAHPGEGGRIAELWRELWDAHDRWGGYAAASDARVYAQVAARLDADAQVRRGQPVLGRHVHLVAVAESSVLGQVEGWFERQGVSPSTPFTCEVRSLIVRSSARTAGVGRALLEGLAAQARLLARGEPSVLAAEVLDANPALTFYDHLGYRPVSWNTRLVSEPAVGADGARRATERDALALALLDSALSARRRAQGDLRFDRPRALEATLVSAIAAHLATNGREDAAELVAFDREGAVRGAATFAVGSLDPPFVPARRAMVGRFGLDPALPPARGLASLVALAFRLAQARGAATVEVTDLSGPGTSLHDAALATGAKPWSRILCRTVPPR